MRKVLFLLFSFFLSIIFIFPEEGESIFINLLEEDNIAPSQISLIPTPTVKGVTVFISRKDKRDANALLQKLITIFQTYPELNLNKEAYLDLEKEYNFFSAKDQIKIRTNFISTLEEKGFIL